VFEIQADMSEFGIPQVVECRDRGGFVGNGNLDLVIRTGDVRKDLALARTWGRRSVPVRMWNSWGDYAAGTQAEYDAARQTVIPPAYRTPPENVTNPTPIP
jgi:hypothetical protein